MGANDEKKDGILRYFQQVADGVHSIVGEGDAPLVLAGVEYLLPIYRHAAEYPHIVESEITRNPEDLSHRHLHRRPSPPVQPLFRKERRTYSDRYHALKGGGRAPSDVAVVISAEYRNPLQAIFVSAEHHLWGTYNEQLDQVESDGAPNGVNLDLLDLPPAGPSPLGVRRMRCPGSKFPTKRQSRRYSGTVCNRERGIRRLAAGRRLLFGDPRVLRQRAARPRTHSIVPDAGLSR